MSATTTSSGTDEQRGRVRLKDAVIRFAASRRTTLRVNALHA